MVDADWQERPLAEVVEYILQRFHRPLEPQLQELIGAADKVERVHGDRSECPRGLASHLRLVRDELMSHMAKEEQILFPALVAGHRGAMLSGPVHVMTHEHQGHATNLGQIRSLTHDLTAPADACGTWRALYEGLQQLEEDLQAHMHLENDVLFPRALRETLPDETRPQ